MRLQFKKTIQIKDGSGRVLFEYSTYDNTLQKTLEEAAKKNVRLAYAEIVYGRFYGADLEKLNLFNATLRLCSFEHCNLFGACLESATFDQCSIKHSNLTCAYMRDIRLLDSSLFACFVNSADFENFLYRNLSVNWCNMDDALNVGKIPLACPREGSFEAYKVIESDNRYIVKLFVPEDAKRSSSFGNKCRCSKAKVLEITRLSDDISVGECINVKHMPTVYRVGEMVSTDGWDDNRWNECSHGIHFFMDEESAIIYNK